MSLHGNLSPADLYGPLLARVQERGILPDGKTFVDAIPRRSVVEIMADFARLSESDSALLAFIEANFDLPSVAQISVPATPTKPLRTYIRDMWKELERPARNGSDNSSALPVRHRHIVPGGRFREIYYWDSFFTMLGLVRDGELELATGIVDAMTDLIETYGHVPNGARTYYVGRSQPPLYHMMVEHLGETKPDIVARRLRAMKREHAWWMEGSESVKPGQAVCRTVRLADGSLLNRYWDPRCTPRDESWGEDVATAAQSNRPQEQVFKDLRAGAESGWDFSSRWLDDGRLSSIRTTTIVPVDLNAFLFGLEEAISNSGDEEDKARYGVFAAERQHAMHRHLWDIQGGYFTDYDLTEDRRRSVPSAAALAPLLAGLATDEQADVTARLVENKLIAAGGLRTTLVESGEQWDQPNGWAPLQWIGAEGLRRYGYDQLARSIAQRWLSTVDTTYRQTGLLYEKYDVETGKIGGGGEYRSQTGFGWTNGVTADFLDTYR
jgi:alpha,alpha-trehalase